MLRYGLIIVLLFISFLSFACLGTAEAALMKAVVLHRHGARTAAGIVHEQIQYNEPFGILTPRGAEQCRAIGKYLRHRYGKKLALPTSYREAKLRTLTTAVKRVILSAEAMLEGLFEEDRSMTSFAGTATYPANDADNILMSPWNAVPSFVLQDRYNVLLRRMTPLTFETLSKADIDHFIRVLDIPAHFCEGKPYFCVELLQDVIYSNITLSNPVDSLSSKLLSKIMTLEAIFVNEMLGYLPLREQKDNIVRLDDNGKDEYIKQVGSAGYPWVSDALQFLKEENPQESNLRHYAAHDYTLTSVFGALGTVTMRNYNLEETVPRYAETIVLELHQEGKKQIVKAFGGFPSQDPSGPIAFELKPMRIQCLRKDGALVDGTEGCKLTDLDRFVQSTKGASRRGTCYYTKKMLKANGRCDLPHAPTVYPNGTGYGCLFFRKKCPMVPCALTEGLTADPLKGYACVKAASPSSWGEFPPIAMSLVIVAIVFMGMLSLRRGNQAA